MKRRLFLQERARLICFALFILSGNCALAKSVNWFIPKWDPGVSTNQKPNAIPDLILEAVSHDKKVALFIGGDGLFHLLDLQRRSLLPAKLISYEDLRIQNPAASIAEEDRRWISGYFFRGDTPFAIVNGQSGESYSSRVQAEIWDLSKPNPVRKMGMSRSELNDFFLHQKLSKTDDGMDAFFTNTFSEEINACEMLPDDRTLIVCSGRDRDWNEIINSLSAWNLDTGKSIRMFKGAHGAIYDFSLNRDRTKILAGGFDTNAFLWDTRSGKLLTTLTRDKTIPKGMETTWAIEKVALSGDAKYAAAASGSGWVFVWEIATQELKDSHLRWPNAPFSNFPPSIAFSPSGNVLAIAVGSKIFLYNVPELQLVKELDGKQAYATKLHFLDENTVAVSSQDGPEGFVTRFWTTTPQHLK